MRAKDVWDVMPAIGQGPFKLMVPWKATAFIVGELARRTPVSVEGWDGRAWLTDRGPALYVEAPR